MMLLELIGIISAALVALVTIGMVVAGASVVFLSLAGLIKGLMMPQKSGGKAGGCRETAFNHAV